MNALWILLPLFALFLLGLWWEKRTRAAHKGTEPEKSLNGSDWIGQDQIDRQRLMEELDVPHFLKDQAE